MKKILTIAALIGAISLAGIQIVSAHGSYYNNNHGNFSERDTEAIEKFQAETNSVRKEIVVKRSELNALLRNDNPDERKVATLAGELYDLETSLQEKAETAGIRGRDSYDHGPGMMGSYGRGSDDHMTGSYGWGNGGHMMGW
jgi:hypothetical protein